MQSNIVYQLNCSSCPATYIGETTRQIYRRLKEHGAPQPLVPTPEERVRRSARIAEKAKAKTANISFLPNSSNDENGDTTGSTKIDEQALLDIKSAVHRHMHETNHIIDWKNWSILTKDRHSYRLCVRESLAIAKCQPSLNVTTRSVLLLI
ncbi:unnamed protein product [Rotaria sp. Silwood2]|nr:unnamed protein product [Rotaria sp. Silwood2]